MLSLTIVIRFFFFSSNMYLLLQLARWIMEPMALGALQTRKGRNKSLALEGNSRHGAAQE